MKTFDAILLLGVELDGQSRPTAEMIARVDEAARAIHEGVLGENGVLIPCGGTLPGKTASEADVMAQLLEARGVPRTRMRLEDKSQLTIENMRYAARLLGDARGKRVLVITSDYHMRRALMTARRVGLRARGRAAALERDAAWTKKRNEELAYTVDLLMGWQDEGKSRPEWTVKLFEQVFGKK